MFVIGLALGKPLPFGFFYSGVSLLQELVTFTILVAVVWAFYRRYIEKLVRLKRGFRLVLFLFFIGAHKLSALLGNGIVLIWYGEPATWTEPVASLIDLACIPAQV